MLPCSVKWLLIKDYSLIRFLQKITICIPLCGLVWLLDIPDILSRFRGAYGNFPENKLQKMNRHVFGRLGYCAVIFLLRSGMMYMCDDAIVCGSYPR